MGTHIDSSFPLAIDRHPDVVRRELQEAFRTLQSELAVLAAKGRYSNKAGDWWIVLQEADGVEPEFLIGEGPFGVHIEVYERTVLFTSPERFFSLYARNDLGIAQPLQRVLCETAMRLGDAKRIAVAAGGLGDTDQAAAVACYEGASFEAVSATLERLLGPPAQRWDQLDGYDYGWYLGSTA